MAKKILKKYEPTKPVDRTVPIFKKGQFLFSRGSVYSFRYNPETKKRLPVYDLYPLFLMFGYRSDHNLLVGLNLHFLPKGRDDFRDMIVKEVMDIAQYDINKVTWNNLIDTYKFLRVAYRQYHPKLLRDTRNIFDPQIETTIPRTIRETKGIMRSEKYGVWTDNDTTNAVLKALRMEPWSELWK